MKTKLIHVVAESADNVWWAHVHNSLVMRRAMPKPEDDDDEPNPVYQLSAEAIDVLQDMFIVDDVECKTSVARELEKFAEQIPGWDDETFLHTPFVVSV